jgi:hypothetical protein
MGDCTLRRANPAGASSPARCSIHPGALLGRCIRSPDGGRIGRVWDRVNVLLDSCTFVWLCSSPASLSPTAARFIDAEETKLWFSVASAWEICLKVRAGKIVLPEKPWTWITGKFDCWTWTWRQCAEVPSCQTFTKIRSIDCSWLNQSSINLPSSRRIRLYGDIRQTLSGNHAHLHHCPTGPTTRR